MKRKIIQIFDPWNRHPEEGSITAIHNWHDTNQWEYAVIKDGKAVKIAEQTWHDLRKAGAAVNMPLYCTED
jgi:hypothetical protein